MEFSTKLSMTPPTIGHPDPESTNQLLQDFGLQSISYTTALQARLDREAAERLENYHAALILAAAEHQRVLRNAQREQARLEQELAQRRQLEDLSQEEAENQKRQEQLDKEIADKRKELEESRLLAERKAIAARNRFQAEELQQQQRVEAELRLQRDQANRSLPISVPEITATVPSIPSKATRPNPEETTTAVAGLGNTGTVTRELTHQRYLDLHKHLKEMRKTVLSKIKGDTKLKDQVGNMRRNIKKSVGQLTQDPKANMIPVRTLCTHILASVHLS